MFKKVLRRIKKTTSEEALRRIKAAKKEHPTELDLDYCNLIELPKELFELPLKTLSLRNNQLTDLTPLAQLTKLESLDLGFNQLTDLTPLAQLTKLQSLDLSNNKLTDLTPLAQLTTLQLLDLSDNKLTDLTPLAQLSKLQSLYLRDNQLTDLTPLAQLTTLQSLDLDRNQLTDLTPLAQLPKLQSLHLSHNQLTDLTPLAQLTTLQSLHLSLNQLTDLTPLAQFTKLQSLVLSENKITDLTPLAQLTKLQSLDLGHNPLTDLTPLAQLTKLQLLDLGHNPLTDLTPLAQLTKLQSLYLISNPLTDLTPLAQLTKLQSLDLSNNKLTDLTPLAQLTTLQLLDLSDNKLTDLTPLAQLPTLQSLNLAGNKLADLTPLAQLTRLQSLDLRGNQLTDLRPLSHLIEKNIPIRTEWFIDIDIEIAVGDNPLTIPPPEIIEQGNAAILDYFQSLEEQGGEPLNEAKLIIVGEPGAGKTTLMETLLDPDYQLSEETESTLGVEVRTGWQFPHPKIANSKFTANIWDFGGQQIQYMTHQFFLTPSAAYVLVSANDRKETTANFPYWFKIIHLLGEEKGVYSPVLVVLNDKNGQFIQQFDLHFYQQRYPELHIKVCHVDLSKRDAHYDAMRETIQTLLTNLPHVSDDRPARWLPIRTELRKRAQQSDHICFKEYAEICQRYEITTELSQTVFSGYLHRLGNLLHFVNDSTLHDFIILNPQWAVDAVYSVLVDNEIARQQGFFSQDKLFAIWKNYRLDERCKLLNLIKQEHFEICYELADQSGQYVAPQLLSDRRPFYQWYDLQSLRFRFQYKFMPKGIITRLIVRLNLLIAKDDQQKDLVWRTGVLLENDGCRAQILEEENQDGVKILDIAITGNENHRKCLLKTIRDEVHKIHNKWFKNIDAEEMIPCHCSYCADVANTDIKFFAFSTLQRAQAQNRSTIQCDKRFEEVSVRALLEGIEIKDDVSHAANPRREITKNTDNSFNVNVNVNQPPIQATPQLSSPTVNPSQQTSTEKTPWYKEWWVVSIAITILTILIAGFAFASVQIGIISGIITGLVFYTLNPKRRFNRAAWFLLILFAAIASPPLISGFVKTLPAENNPLWLDFAVSVGNTMNPIFAALMAGISLLGSLFLFWLDHKQN